MNMWRGKGLVAGAMTVALQVGVCGAGELVIKDGQRLAFLGDSITQQGGNNAAGYVNLVLKGLEVNGIKVSPVKAGISGHKSNDMLGRLDRDVLSKKPDVMTLSCGVNDVWHGATGIPLEQYKTNITAILDACQAHHVAVVVLTSTLIKEPTSDFSRKLDAYNDFLRAIAKERQLPLADLSADMKALCKEGKQPRYLTRDGVHMDVHGDMMMARGVLAALGLSPEQLAKARESWMDMPGAYEVRFGITLRQFEALAAKAEAANSRDVGDYLAKQLGAGR